MKRMRKLMALLVSLMMLFGLTTTAYAVDITIKQDDVVSTESTYVAYKLLDAEKMNDNSGKYNYAINEKYRSILESATGKTEDVEIIQYIEAMVSDTDELNAFASEVYNAITAAGLEEDEESVDGVISDADQGYYLIAESVLSSDTDTFSLVMLDTAGAEDIDVNTKEGEPTLSKQVKEVNDSTGEYSWGASADHDVNDIVEYQITGTVSEKYGSYESYYYSFVDTMDDSLTLQQDTVKVYVDGTFDQDGTYKKDGTDVTGQFEIEKSEHALTVTANLKELTGVTITADSQIHVLYSAQLNEEAIFGTPGNRNTVYLEYENDPYHEADGDNNPKTPNEPEDPGKTPDKINIVFTFTTTVNKQDSAGEALKGAGFTLYKKYPAGTEGIDSDGYKEFKAFTAGDATTFTFAGLDAGQYKISETTIPSGYNKAADIIFEVVAEYDATKEPVELIGLSAKDASGATISSDTGENKVFKVTLDNENSDLSTIVINKPGVVLPSTGGIGTTIFYAVGGVLVLAAVVLLITKKRMSAEK